MDIPMVPTVALAIQSMGISVASIQPWEEITQETLDELSNNLGDDEDIPHSPLAPNIVMAFTDSPMVVHTRLSPNCSKPRNNIIDMIAIHVVAGNCSIETIGNIFAPTTAKASSNYGIGSDGRVGMYVQEKDRSWCTSSSAIDNRAITIEVANTEAKHPWPVSEKAYAALIELCADICRRNNIKKLVWIPDKNNYGNMFVHRWTANKACCGDYLYERHGEIAEAVNQKIGGELTVDQYNELLKKIEGQATTIKDLNDKIEAQNKLISDLLKGPADNGPSGDKPTSWFTESTGYCKRKGIFEGDGHGNFDWQDPLTREAGAQIVYNTLEAAGALDKLPDIVLPEDLDT